MTPSDRIHHIKDIAEALSGEDWAIIDLTLKTFSLPWTDNWSGDKRSYVIRMLDSADDGTLLELAKHLGTVTELEPIVAPTFWSPDDARVFITHVSSIKTKAAAQRTVLSDFGMVAFVAHEDIEPTREWQAEIESALATMDALVALLSPGFNESKWCDQEVGVAIGRQIPIVPVRIDLDPYGLFGKYQAIPAKGRNPAQVAPDIFGALVRKPQIGPKITNSLVAQLRQSPSWSESRRLVALIRGSPFLNTKHIELMREAIQSNVEVGDAHTVPDTINELARKLGV